MQAGNFRYRLRSGSAAVMPVFPLAEALLLPGGRMPLNIFEPRYLQMIDEAMGGDRDHRHDPAGLGRRAARRRRAGNL